MEITRKINEIITILLMNQKHMHVKLTRCTKCGKEYHEGVKNFCSNACYESDLQERIKEACGDDTTHTKKLS